MRVSDNTLAQIRTLRDCIRSEEGEGGQCATVVQELTDLPEFEGAQTTAGYFVTSQGRIIDDHWWLVMDDGSIFDPTQDQFGEEGFGDIVHLSKKDPRHKHYFTFEEEPGIPAEVLQLADHISALRRHGRNRSFMEMVESAPSINWVVPRWARHRNYTLIPVSVSMLDKLWQRDRGFYIAPGASGSNEIKGRYERFDQFYKQDPSRDIEAPEIGLTDNPHAPIAFDDGRHRFAWARDHGVDEIMVLVPAEQAGSIDKLLNLNEVSGAAPSSDAARQSPDVIGSDFVPPEEVEDEFKPEEFEAELHRMQLDHNGSASEGGHLDEELTWEDLAQPEDGVTPQELRAIETYADRLFSKVGIDVAFTRHFLDRVNDPRNVKPITAAELTRLFKQQYRRNGKRIPRLGPDAQAVLKDMATDINVPFVLEWDPGTQMLELISKTVMRTPNFRVGADQEVLTVEDGANLTDEEWEALDYALGWAENQFSPKVCFQMSDFLARKLGWKQESGYFRGEGHYWNRRSDGTIVDATCDQFGEDEPLRIVPPGDPLQDEYVVTTNEVDHPEYMPDGDASVSTNDVRYQERDPRTNTGHPRP